MYTWNQNTQQNLGKLRILHIGMEIPLSRGPKILAFVPKSTVIYVFGFSQILEFVQILLNSLSVNFPIYVGKTIPALLTEKAVKFLNHWDQYVIYIEKYMQKLSVRSNNLSKITQHIH